MNPWTRDVANSMHKLAQSALLIGLGAMIVVRSRDRPGLSEPRASA